MTTWDTSCPDWEERLLAGRSLVPALPLFPEMRDKALRIFNRLRLPDVIGQPTMEEAAGDWFKDFVAAMLGSYDPTTNRRMIQEGFLLVPKKNMKSTGAAGLMVTAMIMNQRPNAEFLLIAPTKEIAGISYNQAKGMIKADPALSALFHLQDHQKTITHRSSGAELKIKAADTDVITGSKSAGILVDETHVFALRSNAREIFVEIRGGLAARPDGFMVQITTQSKAPPTGVFKSELALARDIRDGRFKAPRPRLVVLYELPKRLAQDNGWKDPTLWGLVNPNLGRSVDIDFLRNELAVAERGGREDMSLLASQHFNVEVGLSLLADRWGGADHWELAADEPYTLDDLVDRCEVAVVGIDGGGLDDLMALTVMGRDRETREWLAWTRAWAHDSVFRREEIVSTLRDFEQAGDLVECQDPTQDIVEIADIIERLHQTGLLPEKQAIGLDPHGVAAIVDELAARGIEGEMLVAIPQGYKLSSAVWGAERKLANRTMRPSKQGLTIWSVGNAKVEPRGNAVLITKQAAGKAKIDPLMSMFDAFQLMSRNPQAQGVSMYEQMAKDRAAA